MLVSFILSQEKKPYNLHSVYDFLSYFRFCRQIFQISVKRGGRVSVARETGPKVFKPIFTIEFFRHIFQISVNGGGRVPLHRNTSPMVLIPIFPIEFLEILYFAEAFGGLGCHAFGDG